MSFNNFFIFLFPFFAYVKISKDSSAKYYQNNKKDYKEKPKEDITVFLKGKKKKKQQYGRNDTKIYQKMKNKSLLSAEKKYYEMRKNPLF